MLLPRVYVIILLNGTAFLLGFFCKMTTFICFISLLFTFALSYLSVESLHQLSIRSIADSGQATVQITAKNQGQTHALSETAY
jgi:hypothetical protein